MGAAGVASSRSPVPGACRSDATGYFRKALSGGREDGGGADGASRRLAACGLAASGGAEAGRAGAGSFCGAAHALHRATQGPGADTRLDEGDGRILGKAFRRARGPAEEDGPMTEASNEKRSVVVER